MANDRAPVSAVMQRDVLTLQVDDTLDLLESLMARNRIRHVPVLDGERVVGVVSQRDLCANGLSAALDYGAEPLDDFLRTITVGQAMSKKLIGISAQATLSGAAELLTRHRIGCLPVLGEHGSLEGLVTETDLVRAAYLEGEARPAHTVGARSKWKELLRKELEELASLRDELELQASLGRAEAKEHWEKLEARWRRVSSRLERLREQSSDEAEDLAERLIGRAREDYRRLAKLLAVD